MKSTLMWSSSLKASTSHWEYSLPSLVPQTGSPLGTMPHALSSFAHLRGPVHLLPCHSSPHEPGNPACFQLAGSFPPRKLKLVAVAAAPTSLTPIVAKASLHCFWVM